MIQTDKSIIDKKITQPKIALTFKVISHVEADFSEKSTFANMKSEQMSQCLINVHRPTLYYHSTIKQHRINVCSQHYINISCWWVIIVMYVTEA